MVLQSQRSIFICQLLSKKNNSSYLAQAVAQTCISKENQFQKEIQTMVNSRRQEKKLDEFNIKVLCSDIVVECYQYSNQKILFYSSKISLYILLLEIQIYCVAGEYIPVQKCISAGTYLYICLCKFRKMHWEDWKTMHKMLIVVENGQSSFKF